MSTRADRARIEELIRGRVAALRIKDAAALAGPYADGAVLFDAVGPLRHIGAGAQADRVEEWVGSYIGGIGYDIRELEVAVDGDVAFCHYLYQVSGTMVDGTKVEMWLRSTVCLQRIDGTWMITHEHSSVPFDEAGAAAVWLEP